MTFCKNCKHSIPDDSKFCPFCGEEVVIEAEVVGEEKPQEERNAKCWHVFASVGDVLGLITLITCWLPYSWIIGIYGIVFAILGKRAKPHEEKADRGLRRSIIGTIISFVLFIVTIITIAVLMALGAIAIAENGM